jgi:DNA repair protein RecN (Recombination protein N)
MYQLEEIDKVKPFQEDEEELLETEINNQILLEKSQESLNLVKDRLEAIINNYQSLEAYLERIKDLSELKNINTDTLIDETSIKDLLYKIDNILSESVSEVTQDDLNNRIYVIQKLKKKLGCKTLKEVIELEVKILSEINHIENYPEKLEEMTKLVQFLEKEYFNFCEILSKEREYVYKELIIPELINNLRLLGFDYIDLDVEHNKKSQFSPNGLDDIEFKISFNKGFSTNPIRKIVSGGEASRISLAMKLLKNDGRTLILDEIETGLSGETLKKLANSLKRVSQDSQIICISHSEEIIEYADKKIKIYKEENQEENRIETKVA